ncbi:MAG: hypothetical protein ACYTHJ_01990 [Planctomycetota bacterium]|jgi:hypothetical protein
MNKSTRTTRGFTLAETLVSMVAISALMAGMGSAILISSKSMPELRPGGMTPLTMSAEVVNGVIDELQSAAWVRSIANNSVVFSVPDRDGDGQVERVVYYWSGTEGDPLKRKFNHEPPIVLLEDVTAFDISMTSATSLEVYPGPMRFSESAAIMSNDDGIRATLNADADNWLGTCFTPKLASNAEAWSFDSFGFWFMGTFNSLPVRVYERDVDGRPTGEPLQQVQFSADIKSFMWLDIPFSQVPDLDPGQGVCVVFAPQETQAITLAAQSPTGKHPATLDTVESRNTGADWMDVTDQDMQFVVSGRQLVPGPKQTARRGYYTGVKIMLQTADLKGDTVQSSARMLNRPEVLKSFWEADFSNELSDNDANIDTEPDWHKNSTTYTIVYLTEKSLKGRPYEIYSISGEYQTHPDENFDYLTTVNVVMEATTALDEGAKFYINADWDAGTCTGLLTELVKNEVGNQELSLVNRTGVSSYDTLAYVGNLPAGPLDVRLLIDPVLDTVYLKVNDEAQGTYDYASFMPGTDDRFALLGSPSNTAAFGYVSIRVGGNWE